MKNAWIMAQQDLIKYWLRSICCLLSILLIQWLVPANSWAKTEKTCPHSTQWVDSVFTSLSLEERIAQLMMVRVQTDRTDPVQDEKLSRWVQAYGIGGIAFFRGGPVRQVTLTNRLQNLAKVPLLVAMDAEFGPAMRLDSLPAFPYQMTLGAINGDHLIYEMGLDVGRQLRRLGVHMNFAPVVDVNNNPANPVINHRAFGECRESVTQKSLAYMRGLQDAGILACAKHFPGHGDTDADSHYTLPLLRHTYQEIDSIHLYPFRELINHGLHAVMTAHLAIPALDSRANLASSLSPNVVSQVLQDSLGFRGLIVTDALDMRGVTDHFSPGELEIRALLAGNDVLLLPQNLEKALRAIRQAVESGRIPEEVINKSCRKVLYYKEKAGLARHQPLQAEQLHEDLNQRKTHLLIKNLAASSITLVRNQQGLIPLRQLTEQRIAALAVGDESGNAFQQMVWQYHPASLYSIEKEHTQTEADRLLEKLSEYELVIVSVHRNSIFSSRRYGLSESTVDLVKALSQNRKVILTLFANPYALAFFGDAITDMEAILVAYQDGQAFEEAAAQVLFGGQTARGRLPVRVDPHFPLRTGIPVLDRLRIGFAEPEEVGIYGEFLLQIDSIVETAMEKQAFPGAQVVLVKDGLVFFQRAYGTHGYDESRPVHPTDLYDLASITKVAAGTPALMLLLEQEKLDLDDTLGEHLPYLHDSDKNGITIREVLNHRARLHAWIPFYRETLTDGRPDPSFFSHERSAEFPVQVAHNLYLHRHYRDTLLKRIMESPLRENDQYLYSDLGFILLGDIIEKQAGMPLESFVDFHLYRPLGLFNTGFLAHRRFPPERIVPSARDETFRMQVLHGHVHDPAAAMLGGVAAHAGLFSNALDVAVLMQMYLQGGSYGGQRFFHPETIGEFTRIQDAMLLNRRGLGFDKPNPDPYLPGPSAAAASLDSFGHSGFTGTLAWADPAENLVYVFLSNRTYPDDSNRLIVEKNVRTNIQQTVYDALFQSRALDRLFLP